jgi:ethanolamine utilization protein EutA
MSSDSGRDLMSVGIDVGTTTTKVVFSTLHIRDVARLGFVPRIEVDARSVWYVGPARFTPLHEPDEIDAGRLLVLVEQEYTTAGIDHAAVETGAVIITGEAARRKNADAVLETLSGLAGEFVVTVAGPNLEAQIAARGSSAARYSTDHYTTVINVDVGGGSSNAAVFRSGRHIASSSAMVGGRGVELEATSGMVTHVTPAARTIIERLRLPIDVGRRADVRALRQYTDALADLIVDLVTATPSELLDQVRLTAPLNGADRVAAVFLSGGVGRCYYEHAPADSLDEIAAFGDVGPLLAQSLRVNPRLRALTVLPPTQTLSATVIGAASQTVTLSGTTIWARPHLLPLRNLPVVEPALDGAVTAPDKLAHAIRRATQRWDAEGDGRVAIALELPEGLAYPELTQLAEGLAHYAGGDLPKGVPLVLITEADYAQVLGQTLQGLRPDLPLVAIDQIGLGEGDFIDIGTPLLDGRAVPVSVKTLVFYQ